MELGHELRSSLSFDLISGESAQRDLVEFLNINFAVPQGASFYDDFSVWDERFHLPMARIGAFRGHKLVATASIRKAELKLDYGSLPIGIIGCVATDPAWRSLGLASQVIALALHWARERKLAMVVLWGAEHDLYRRLGFELCGEELRLPLYDVVGLNRASDFVVGRGWVDGLMKPLLDRTGGLLIKPSDAEWISNHKNIDWWWLGSSDAPTAYAAVGRGIDLPNTIHEWGGDRETLMLLFSHMLRHSRGLELLGSEALFKHYGIAAAEKAGRAALCLTRVLNLQAILSAHYPGQEFKMPLLNDQELVKALFEPGGDGRLWNGLLPLPLWFWGLDGA